MKTIKGKQVSIVFAGRLPVEDYERLVAEVKTRGVSLCQFVNNAVLAALPSETGTSETGD